MNQIKKLGAMIDVSRGAVMNFNYFKVMVDALSKMGYTFLELYSEDIYDVKEEPLLGYLRGKYSVNELKQMDEYAKSKGIELIPCIQTLAHFSSLCLVEKINDELFDIDDILLCDSERTYEFIENIFKTCREAFSSNQINIGMDEAWHLGQGRYLLKNGFNKKSEIILKHLNKVAEIAKKYGYECQMWSDMFMDMIKVSDDKDSIINEISKLIPDNVTLVKWDYFTKDKTIYDDDFKTHKLLNEKVMFAGGAWCWKGFVPLNYFTLETMEPAIRSCLDNNIETLIMTLWGDDGNETPKISTLPALFACAEFSRNNFDMSSIKEKFQEMFDISFDIMMDLDLPNYVYQNGIRRTDFFVPGKNLFYQDPFLGKVDYLLDKYDRIDYQKYTKILKDDIKKAGNFAILFKEAMLLSEFLSHKAYLGYDLRKYYETHNVKGMKRSLKEFDLAIKSLRKFKKVFDKLWLYQNKAYCLEIHDTRLGGLLERLKSCKRRLKEYLKHGGKIEELEEKQIAFWFDDKFYSNKYRDIISTFNI